MRLSLPGFAASLAAHLGLAAFVWTSYQAPAARAPRSVVDLTIVEPAPAPPAPAPELTPPPAPRPPPAKAVRRMKVKKVKELTRPAPVAEAPAAPEPPAPAETPAPPTAPAPLPVFALDMAATVSSGGGISVRAEAGGGSAFADPDATRDQAANGFRGKAAPGPAPQLAAAEVLEITRMPRCPQPDVRYPVEARREGREGEVELRLVIDETGRVASAEVTRSAGTLFDSAAIEAARRIRCSPGRMGAVAAAVPIPYTIGFVLEG
ncbi:MAG: TonB family protein [Deltaproteobacteria bacterium]|nr:TonB family protein [Deltaproteobacteria bacterium]